MRYFKRLMFHTLTQKTVDDMVALLPDHDRLSMAIFYRRGLVVPLKYVRYYQTAYDVYDSTAIFYLLYEDEQLLGFSFGVRDRTFFRTLQDTYSQPEVLGGICIHPDYRRLGLSYKLMRRVIQEFGSAWFQHKNRVFTKSLLSK